MMQAIADLQAEKVPRRSRRKPVKVLLPVNLRTLLPAAVCGTLPVYHPGDQSPHRGLHLLRDLRRCPPSDGTGEQHPHPRAKFAANVASEKSPVLKVMPLFIKNIAMKAVA